MIKLRHIGIVVINLEESIKFYEDIFSLTLVNQMIEEGQYVESLVGIKNASINWAKLKAKDNTIIELLEYKNSEFVMKDNYVSNRLGCSHIAMSVDNIESIYDKLQDYDCKCNSKPLFSPNGKVKVMYCHDINGTILEIVEEL